MCFFHHETHGFGGRRGRKWPFRCGVASVDFFFCGKSRGFWSSLVARRSFSQLFHCKKGVKLWSPSSRLHHSAVEVLFRSKEAMWLRSGAGHRHFHRKLPWFCLAVVLILRPFWLYMRHSAVESPVLAILPPLCGRMVIFGVLALKKAIPLRSGEGDMFFTS